MRQILAEGLIILTATFLLILLTATMGLPGRPEPAEAKTSASISSRSAPHRATDRDKTPLTLIAH